MALRPALDLELLRTLVFIAEEASFTKAGERVGRTQSAVTLQVQKLEALVGQPLLARSRGDPSVVVEVTEGFSCQLAPQIREGAFDLVFLFGDHEPRNEPRRVCRRLFGLSHAAMA